MRSAWSPHGQLLSFLGGAKIYVIKADGSGLTHIAENPKPGRRVMLMIPAWQPLPSEEAG